MSNVTHSAEYLAVNNGPALRSLNIAMIIFPLVFVAFRMFVRHYWTAGIQIDDWMLLASCFFFLILSALNLLMINHGVGKHLAAISTPDFIIIIKGLIGSEVVYTFTICLTKISILSMYTRIFPIRSVKVGAKILVIIAICWSITIITTSIFQCTPIPRAWDTSIPGHCINLRAYFIGTASPNILTDFAILALPMPQIWKLHLSTNRKISLTIVVLLGSFVIGASIYRFFTLLTFDILDFTYTTAAPSTWTVVEAAAALVSACLPTYGPAIQVLKLKLGLYPSVNGSQLEKATGNSHPLVTIGGSGDKFYRPTKDQDFRIHVETEILVRTTSKETGREQTAGDSNDKFIMPDPG